MTRSLPRKSEKSVKIGNKRLGIALQRTPNMGGPSGEGLYVGNRLGGTHYPPYAEPSRECIPPQQGAMGPLGLGSSSRACNHGSHGTHKRSPVAKDHMLERNVSLT